MAEAGVSVSPSFWPLAGSGRGDCSTIRAFGEAALRVRRPKWPLLESGAAPAVIEPDDPQVTVGLGRGIAVADLETDHSGIPLDGDYLAFELEGLAGSLATLLHIAAIAGRPRKGSSKGALR